MYSTSVKALDHCISVYACFAQHEDAKAVLGLLLFVMVVVTTLILHLRVDQNEHTQQVQENIFMPKPREVAIDIPNLVNLPAPPSMKNHRPSENSQDANSPNPTIEVKETADLPCKQQKLEMHYPVSPVASILGKTPHLDTTASLVRTSQSLTDDHETVNNGNATVRHQSVLDMSDTDSLLHQASTPAEETSNCNFDIENPLNLSPEGEQTSYGVSIQSSPQAAAPPMPIPGIGTLTPPPVPGPEAEEPDLKFELKVATWVTIISAGGIVSVISGVIGNEKALLPRKLLFKGFTSLNYIALVSGIGLFILIKISPNIPCFVRIVKFIMWIAIGSLVYSLGMATCIMFPAKVEVVLILVVPLVLVGLVGIFSFANRD